MTITEFINYVNSDIEEDTYEAIFKKEPKGLGEKLIAKVKSACKWIKEFITVKIPNFFKNLFKKNPDTKFSDAVKSIKANAEELGVTEKELGGMVRTGAVLTGSAAVAIARAVEGHLKKTGKLVDAIRTDAYSLIDQGDSLAKQLTSWDSSNDKFKTKYESEKSKLTDQIGKENRAWQSKYNKADRAAKREETRFTNRYSTDERKVGKFRSKVNKGKEYLRDNFGLFNKKYEKDIERKEAAKDKVLDINEEKESLSRSQKRREAELKDKMKDSFKNERNSQYDSTRQYMYKADKNLEELRTVIENDRRKMAGIEAKYNRKYKSDNNAVQNALNGDAEYQRLKRELESCTDLKNRLEKSKADIKDKTKYEDEINWN